MSDCDLNTDCFHPLHNLAFQKLFCRSIPVLYVVAIYIGFRWFSVDPFGPTKSLKKNRTSKVYRKKEPDWINSRDTLRSSHEQAARVGLHETSCRFLFSHDLASAPSMDSFVVSWSVKAAKGAWQTLTHWENVWRLKWYPTDILKEWPIWCHMESSHITFLVLDVVRDQRPPAQSPPKLHHAASVSPCCTRQQWHGRVPYVPCCSYASA